MAPTDGGAPDLAGVSGPASFAVTHYDFTLDLATRSARALVSFEVTAPGNCVTLSFRPPAATDVTLNGVPGEAVTVANGSLSACLGPDTFFRTGDKGILGATAIVPKSTLGNSQVGYSTRKDRNGNPFTYLLSWVGGCDRSGPCDASPDRFATYRFVVDHAAGTQVLCPGTVTATDTRTTCDFAFDGAPTYSGFGLMASPSWTPVSIGDWGGVAVTLHDYANTGVAKAFDRAAGRDHFQWLQSILGPYPYGKELRFVVGPTYWAGFEHPGNITLSETLATGSSAFANGLRHTAMHEVTHQWAGNHATLAATEDFFWKEAISEYLTFVYEDEHVSHEDARTTLAAWKGWAGQARYFPVPVEKVPLFDYYSDAYGPGPMVLLRQFEVMYSRKAVIDALANVLGTSKPHAVSVDDLRKALETTTGDSLADYFAAWIHGTGAPAWPLAKVTATDLGGGMTKVAVDVTTTDGVARGCKFKVRLTGAAGAKLDIPVDLGVRAKAFAPVTVQTGFTVTGNEVDPDYECLIWRSDMAPSRVKWRRVEPWVVGDGG